MVKTARKKSSGKPAKQSHNGGSEAIRKAFAALGANAPTREVRESVRIATGAAPSYSLISQVRKRYDPTADATVNLDELIRAKGYADSMGGVAPAQRALLFVERLQRAKPR